MKRLLCFIVASCLVPALHADDPKTPPPPELKALAETLVSAIKSKDDAALAACWHSPETLAKLKAAEALAASGTSPTEINVDKEREKELKRGEKDRLRNQQRIDEIRALITKYFGDISALKFVELEVDPDDDAADPDAAFDEVDIHLLAADGTKLRIELDDALRIDGVWKFKGRIEDKLCIELTDP
ncbi:hypothetical protein [Prosthecobacter fluviatilis]|uniref:Uncharacterized protein n=1 Tax=Prosthecobacter fluviatilis TaxID=445931 RepID=A0ABW0KWR7_9BACT